MHSPVAALAASLFLAAVAASPAPPGVPAPAPSATHALFAVSEDGLLEPVAVRAGSRFLPADATSAEPPKGFAAAAKASLAATRGRVQFIFGRQTLATLTVAPIEGGGNAVRVPPAVHLGGAVNALASPTLGGSAAEPRRAPTAAERAEALGRAAAALGTVAQRLTVRNLTAIDLGAGMALVGTVEQRGTSGGAQAANAMPRRDKRAFFVYERPAGMTLFNAQTVEVTEPLLEEIDEYLVDAVDLPGSGPALVTRSVGYDAHTYLIYARSGGRWRKIYMGGGAAM